MADADPAAITDATIGPVASVFQQAPLILMAMEGPELRIVVWNTAADLGYSHYFIPAPGQTITDDHVPLLNAGLHVIDVIDIDYPWHHTPQDTFDKVSAQSLQIVGDVATKLLTSQ